MTNILKLEDIAALGFDVQEIFPRVFKIDNFISTEELSRLHFELSTYNEEAWSSRYLEQMRKNSLEKFGRDDIENLKAEGLLEITDSWADKNASIANEGLVRSLHERATTIFDLVGGLEVTGFNCAQRMYDGSELRAHYDQYSDKLVEYAAVLYLNDDYVGGELFFSNFASAMRPGPGSLLIFPGTEQYEHGVHPVKAGPVRYVIPAFIKTQHPDGSMAGWGNFG